MKAFVLALLLSILPSSAFAHVLLHTSDGRPGPVELSLHDGAYTGSFVIENDGEQPLTISRVAVRDDDSVKAPRGLSVKATEQGPIAPHAKRTVDVRYEPGPPQLFAHVVVTSSDETTGEVAMGVHAQVDGPLGPLEAHLLSAMIVLPILGALLLLAIALAFPQGQSRATRAIALGATFGQLALFVLAFRRFAPDFDRTMGNDGLQLVERAVWIRPYGIEWFVALDGHALLFLGATTIVSALVTLVNRSEREGWFAIFLATLATITCAIVARDLALLVFTTGAASIGATILVGASRPNARRAATTMAVFVMGGTIFLILMMMVIRTGSTRGFLVDGSTTPHTFALPELERVSFTRSAGVLAGIPIVEIAIVFGTIGFGMLSGILPFHPWMTEVASASSAPVATLAIAIVPRLGAIGMLRVFAQVLPEGTRWASAALVGLGAITMVHAGACAIAENDLVKTAARVSSFQSGLVLVGIGATTPQGLAAASTITFSGTIALALVIASAGFLETRTNDRDISRLGGLLRETPLFSACAIAGLLGCAAIPLTAPFHSMFLALLGALPVHPVLACIAALGWLLVLAACYRAIARVFFGSVPEEWRKSSVLEPFGGKVPDLRQEEAWTLGTLAVLVILLGVYPSPMVGALAGAIRDAVARANLGPLQLGF